MSVKPVVRGALEGGRRRRLMAGVCAGALVLAAVVLSVTSLAVATSSFADVPASYPYHDAIADLASRGIVSGYAEDGTFRPDNLLIRQQFAKIIVLSLGYSASDADICTFSDVQKSLPGSYVDPSDTNYPDHYIAVCALHGITQGKTATIFAPYENITRQQLISMVARAASLPDPPADFVSSFSSGQFYPREHYANARKADYAGLLAGLQGVGPVYDFIAPATRGESAQLLHNLIVLLAPTTTTAVSSTTTTTSGSTTTTAPCG
jgi:hypothetical protein